MNIITKRHKGNRHISGQLQGGYRQSKYASGETKGYFLYSNNKLTIDANYSYTNINAYAEAEHEAHHPLNNEKVAYYDLTTNRNKGHSHQYRAGLDYQFAANHALIMLIYIIIFHSAYRLQLLIRIMKLQKTSCLTGSCMKRKRTL